MRHWQALRQAQYKRAASGTPLQCGARVAYHREMHLAARRYTSERFPAYRFVPGRGPHPVRDPAGHSYDPPGTPPAVVVYTPPELWQESPSYLYGCDLYNHGYWWEAHEAWEGLWRLCDRESLQFHHLQGLIQVSVAHLKLHMNNRRGARRLLDRADKHLHAVFARVGDERFMGLDLRAWHGAVHAYAARMLNTPASAIGHDPGTYPYLILATD
jgi:hypothetical protein